MFDGAMELVPVDLSAFVRKQMHKHTHTTEKTIIVNVCEKETSEAAVILKQINFLQHQTSSLSHLQDAQVISVQNKASKLLFCFGENE